MKKKLIAALLSAAMVVSVVPVFASDAAADEETATESSTESPLAGKKIAYIMYMSSATIFQMWSDSFTATAEKLGMEASTFFCNDNADTWKSTIEQCAQGGYDGLMVSHGGQEYAYDFLSGILEQYPDLKIVTFDTPFKDAEAGEPVNILQVQQGAGYNSPFDRRQVGYEPFETDGKIKTVERIAPIDDQNATSSMRDVTAATLQKYGEGDIDGIWCCYDAYAQGVYQALREANSDIPMVSVDICNEDIQFMQEGKNWKACATTNWTSNGEFACRVLALEMADQYEDIEAASCYYADPGAWMEIPSVIVTQEMVTSKEGINIENLAEVAGEDYSDTSWMPTCDWMVSALGH